MATVYTQARKKVKREREREKEKCRVRLFVYAMYCVVYAYMFVCVCVRTDIIRRRIVAPNSGRRSAKPTVRILELARGFTVSLIDSSSWANHENGILMSGNSLSLIHIFTQASNNPPNWITSTIVQHVDFALLSLSLSLSLFFSFHLFALYSKYTYVYSAWIVLRSNHVSRLVPI